MTSTGSRSSIFRKCRELLKQSAQNPTYVTMKMQDRFNILLQERAALQETMEKNFFTLMKDSGMEPLEYVKTLGEIDAELPGKSISQFDEMLQYFWDGISDYQYDFVTVVDVLCNAFPNYERIVLKSAYDAFSYGNLAPNYNFALLLERMADFDEIEGVNHFSSDVDKNLPAELEEPIVNVSKKIHEIFDILDLSSPLADIIWILEIRFGFSRAYLEQLAFDVIFRTYDEYELNEMIRDATFKEFFKLPEGYNLFFEYLPAIIRNQYPDCGFRALLKNYHLDIDVQTRQVE